MKKYILTLSLIFSNFIYANFETIENFGHNPGQLKLVKFIPVNEYYNRPLVIALHGCTQNAKEYALNSGWKELANKYQFNLLLPEQIDTNNSMKCFNWFSSSDFSKDKGETASIITMIKWMKQNHSIDEQQIFITGLSAGAALANSLLANYPQLFKGGSIIAGIPFGCAFDTATAWLCMKGFQFPYPSTNERGNAIRKLNPKFKGPWPNIQIIHSKSDHVVSYSNARYLTMQWLNVFNHKEDNFDIQHQNSAEFKNYGSKLQFISILNSKHGQPISLKDKCGNSGKYYINTDICAAYEAIKFFRF